MSIHVKVAGAGDIGADLIAQLDAARGRLDASVLLLQQALDLRERLWFGLDLDDMADEVARFERAAARHRGARR